ncbi:helix-turn-helix domain-containing protein [Luteibacter pinisoli]|uniref:Helix-turn-helix domain-containing protein n=1 Tax=Luteibacter pinisoli TaxID=2589080 RepID=A0A4Y5Z1Z5_9GAMM|nr:helix-turn-helix domain-containing protein [Luteibacter pinisoli]QDE38443.1 helix-turn-helix domain-containing protein [Luteibacter pinisoli]
MSQAIFYTTKEVAAMWKVSPRTLENWRNLRQGPAFVKFGSRVLYSSEALEEFAARNAIGTQAAPP